MSAIMNIEEAFEHLNIKECFNIVAHFMPRESNVSVVVNTVIGLMEDDRVEMNEEQFSYYMNAFFETSNPYPVIKGCPDAILHQDMSSGNWKVKLAELITVSKAKEMGVSWNSIPDAHKDAVGESFMDYYCPGDSGDDDGEVGKSEEDELMKAIQYLDNFLESPTHSCAIKDRSDHHANIGKDKAKHGKSSCKRRDWYGNYSMKGQKRHTSKKLRKEFFIPSGKCGYKKMQDVDYIF